MAASLHGRRFGRAMGLKVMRMENAASYHERAEECRRRAAETTWPPDKAAWAKLEGAWLKLAHEVSQRNSHLCVTSGVSPLDSRGPQG